MPHRRVIVLVAGFHAIDLDNAFLVLCSILFVNRVNIWSRVEKSECQAIQNHCLLLFVGFLQQDFTELT
jgi:hypothetical protein